jgi:uncharacterized protein YchJ
MIPARDPCPCGSTRLYPECCGLWHAGAPAPDAQSLMRSRYCAYVLSNEQYLLATWHPGTRPDSTSYPSEQVHYIQGPVELTIPANTSAQPIALLRLDTDWYQSTKHELLHLYARIARGGILIVDDYGHLARRQKGRG